MAQLPQISLDLCLSPLLADADKNHYCDEALATLLKSISTPLPSLSFASSKPRTADKNKPLPRTPPCQNQHQDLPPGSPAKPEYPLATSKQIISLLNLLDKLDTDMTAEVQRIKENIKETRDLIKEYKKERRDRRRSMKEKMATQVRQTLAADSDFWAGV